MKVNQRDETDSEILKNSDAPNLQEYLLYRIQSKTAYKQSYNNNNTRNHYLLLDLIHWKLNQNYRAFAMARNCKFVHGLEKLNVGNLQTCNTDKGQL